MDIQEKKHLVDERQNRAVGVLPSREDAEGALEELKNSGFPMHKVSIIVRDAEQNAQLVGVPASDRVGDREVGSATAIVADAVTGSVWGTLLVGLGSLAIPGVGPVIAAGSLGLALVASVAGTGIAAAAAGDLVKGLADLGIPEEHARLYGDRLHQGNYLVILEGSEDEIGRAEQIFSDRGIEEWGTYERYQG